MTDQQIKVGPRFMADGGEAELRGDRTGAQVVTDAHGKYFEAASRGVLFTGGMGTVTSISNATFTVATTGATATPIVGLWNPVNSGKNMILVQAILGVSQTALQATGPGAFVWMFGLGQNALTLGVNPTSALTLQANGSVGKVFGGTALTGLVGAIAPLRGAAVGGGSAIGAAFLATQVGGQPSWQAQVENFDGGLILPPGGLLSLQCTITPVGHSAVSGLIWEEMSIL